MKQFNKKIFFPALLVTLWYTAAFSQNVNPGSDIIYDNREVAVIKITMSPGDKTFLLAPENKNSELYLISSLRYQNSTIDTLLPAVGIRLRGNTSRDHPKKSFKIDFKEFGGSKFYGYKKFNLKAENNDPSCIRELMTLEIFRLAGVPAARSSHTRVYMNGEYMGLYLNVEQIDDEFALTRFGNDTGNLYKCKWGTTLENNGQIYDPVLYELETNKEANNRSMLANFVKVLNQTPDASFRVEIEKVLDVDKTIKFMAVEALTGHWDSYSYLKNNIYIYENPQSGLIEIIPYDCDNTFGIDWVGSDWAKRDLNDWARHGEARPLNTRLLAVGEYRNLYNRELNRLMENGFSAITLYPKFDFYKALLLASIMGDSYYHLTFGFTPADYIRSHDTTVVRHAPYGLIPFVNTRTFYARQQIPVVRTSDKPVPQFSLSVYPNPSPGRFIHVSRTNGNTPEFRVYNSCGTPVYFSLQHQGSTSTLVFTQSLPAGLYIITSGTDVDKFLVR
jgi:spore coat protein H